MRAPGQCVLSVGTKCSGIRRFGWRERGSGRRFLRQFGRRRDALTIAEANGVWRRLSACRSRPSKSPYAPESQSFWNCRPFTRPTRLERFVKSLLT
jgi:hypothetical protein